MGSSNKNIQFKLLWVRFKHLLRSVLKRLPFAVSIFFLVIPVVISLFLLFPQLFSCSPAFPYLIEKYTLPLIYEYDGKVILLDSDNNLIDQSVTVNIGGYSIRVNTNEDFVLKFTSESTDCVFATVEYSNQNNIQETYTFKIVTSGHIKLSGDIYIYE